METLFLFTIYLWAQCPEGDVPREIPSNGDGLDHKENQQQHLNYSNNSYLVSLMIGRGMGYMTSCFRRGEAESLYAVNFVQILYVKFVYIILSCLRGLVLTLANSWRHYGKVYWERRSTHLSRWRLVIYFIISLYSVDE